MKPVYVILTFTGSFFSVLIRSVSGVPYSHVSLSLRDSLKPMYSFGRLNPWVPIPGGFVHERTDLGLYGRKPKTTCQLYRIEVSDEQHDALYHAVRSIRLQRSVLKYDYLGFVQLAFRRSKERNRFVCSTFVAEVFAKGGMPLFDQPSWLVTPLDFYKSSRLELLYEGFLKDVHSAIPRDKSTVSV